MRWAWQTRRAAWSVPVLFLLAVVTRGSAQTLTETESRAAAATQPTTQPEAEPTTQSAPGPGETPPPPPPKYLDLRYDEDYSYLDGPPGSYQPDLFDPIKWIHLNEDTTLSIGGEVRGRLEAETNTTYGSREPAQDTVFLHRYLLHADLKYRKLARVFVQGIAAFIEDRDLPPRAVDEDRWDVHQLFGDLRFLGEDIPLTVRFGRQELSYGRERVISPLDWANVRRTFDGVKVMYTSEPFDLDFFYVRPVPIDLNEGLNRKPNQYREEGHFYGAYSKWRPFRDHYLENYFLAYRDTGDIVSPNRKAGDLTYYTIGGRAGGKWNQFDYDGELAGQWGQWAGDTIQAWMGGVDGGWTAKVPWSPRFGGGFDFGTGDEDPFDNVVQTSNQLFPLGHAYLGYLDLFGRQNILATNLNLTFKPHEKVTTRLAWYTFWNDEVRDAIYNVAGVPGRRDVNGFAGHDLGNELDLTINVALDRHTSLLFGYSHFWCGNFIQETGPDQDPDFIYFQYMFKF